MTESLIEDIELIQGDTSSVYFFKHPDNIAMDVNWVSRYTISIKRGDTPIVDRVIIKNTGNEIVIYPVDTRFVFQILESESSLLTVGSKYEVTVQITNPTIDYNQEVAQFTLKCKAQGVI